VRGPLDPLRREQARTAASRSRSSRLPTSSTSDELSEAHAKLRSALVELIGPSEAPEHAAHLAIPDSDSPAMTMSPTGRHSSSSARVLVEALAKQVPTLLFFEGHPLGRRELAGPARDARGRALRDVPADVASRLGAAGAALRAAGLGAAGFPPTPRFPLEPLSNDAIRGVGRAAARRVRRARRPARSVVAQTAEGNPLFIEELAGVAVREIGGRGG